MSTHWDQHLAYACLQSGNPGDQTAKTRFVWSRCQAVPDIELFDGVSASELFGCVASKLQSAYSVHHALNN